MEIKYEYSLDLNDLLREQRVTVAVSTYQAGKIALIGPGEKEPAVSFHQFDRPMGMACDGEKFAIAANDIVWFLRNTKSIPDESRPGKTYDACYLAREAHVTGEIQSHDVQWVGNELWVVNTRFSCLCTLDPKYSFVPRWKPPFITELASEDRCHLNGLAVDQTGPRFVTMLGESNEKQGWRPHKINGGCLMDVRTNQILVKGFAMPHSPRLYQDRLWLLDSGTGSLLRFAPQQGKCDTIGKFPGFTRGLAFHKNLAFVGLSKIRETSTFGGMPIAENRKELKCGLGIVDLNTGALAGKIEFVTGVEEIFEVHVLPGVAHLGFRGPHALKEERGPIWVVPQG